VQPLLHWKRKECYSTCVCICRLMYAACNALAPCYNLWPAPLYISQHCLINDTIFNKKIFNMKCVYRVSLQRLSEIFFILRRTERDIIENVRWFSYKVPIILFRFYRNLNFLDGFSKNPQISNFMKIVPVGTELLHEDGQK
jgi:hypothetical protein